MSALPPRGTRAHAPPLDHLDADASSRRGQTVHQRRRRSVRNHHNDALAAHFQRLSMNKPRISSRFTYSERLSKASRKGPTTIRASSPIHATIWGCERNARTRCQGSSWQGMAVKNFLWDYVTMSSEMWGRARPSLKCISVPEASVSPPVLRERSLFTCCQYGTLIGEYFIICIKILHTFHFLTHMTL